MITKYLPEHIIREMDACDYLARKVLRHTDIADGYHGSEKIDYHGIISAAIHYLMEEEEILDADYILYQKENAEKQD